MLRKVSPYAWIFAGGVILVTTGAALQGLSEPLWGFSESELAVFGETMRSVGSAALIGSVIGPLISRRVQAQAFEDAMQNAVLENALDALAGIHPPKDLKTKLRSYLSEMKRVTEFRAATFTLDWEESNAVLRVKVQLEEGGQNMSSDVFQFEELWAPASLEGYNSAFEGFTLRISGTNRRATNLHRRKQAVPMLSRHENDGRVCLDLRQRPKREISLDPGDTYTLDQTFVVYLPTAWTFPLETFAAHPEQTIRVSGNAIDDLDIGAVLSNEELHPISNGDPTEKVYEPRLCAFPGQTTVVRWWPRGTIVIDQLAAEGDPVDSRIDEPQTRP